MAAGHTDPNDLSGHDGDRTLIHMGRVEVAVPADFEVRPRTTVQHPSERLSDTRPTSELDTLREHLDRERERADRAEIARDAADAGQVVEAEDGVGMALALHLTGQRERLGSGASISVAPCWRISDTSDVRARRKLKPYWASDWR
jgi:hypothetical protein